MSSAALRAPNANTFLTGTTMRLGYDQPLYLLPFDHRHSYLTGILDFTAPLTAEQREAVIDSKRLIYDGFKHALGSRVPVTSAGILIDEEFGAGILRDAAAHGYVTALSTERIGSGEFELAYGPGFAAHLGAVRPTFAKALVRYNPEGDAAANRRQAARLKRLSDYCRAVGPRFMVELLAPATRAQEGRAQADTTRYALGRRPALTLWAIHALQDAGVEPDVWAIEGLDRREDCERLVATVRRDGRDDVGCIVLGHGADELKVTDWLETAASVPGFIGFAVGRTTVWNAVAGYVARRVTRQEAVSLIARRYRQWAAIFEQARARAHAA